MLAKIFEGGKEKVSQYWPDEKETPIVFGEYSITLQDIEIKKENTTRRIELKHIQSNTIKKVVQLHYTAWPDHGVPDSTKTFLELIEMSHDNNLNKSPIVVHCSAGVGRTGTFIAVDYLLKKADQHEQQNLKKTAKSSSKKLLTTEEIMLNLPKLILEMRNQRPCMNQSE